MHLAPATKLAARILSALAPYCERFAIAGSIRRQRPWVNDIDLVLLPKPGQLQPLLYRCSETATLVQGKTENFIFRLSTLSRPTGEGRGEGSITAPLRGAAQMLENFYGFQLDLFIARPATTDLFTPTPGNWGTLLLCRTGSKEHNIHLVMHAKRIGLEWSPCAGVIKDGKIIASETEEDIFRALNLPYLNPEQRER